jgi:GTP-binding protein
MPAAGPPIVAIVGRPNVGKSTLFNRYAGYRRALVDDTPGVTRDRITEEIQVGARRVLIVDTGGLDPAPDSAIESAVQEQARAAVAAADAILFVVDGRAGILPQERELARWLRRAAKPVAVAVNKIDAPQLGALVAEFHALGLPLVRGVSAEHGAGAWDLLEELVAALPPAEPAPEPEATAPEAEPPIRIALVGRPNVGKSSLLNRLAGEERVVVSDQPGTTRDAVDVALTLDGVRYVFVDTAGLRRPGRRDRLAERGSALMAIRAIERAQVALVVMDAGEGFTDQDAHLLGLVRERGCACVLLANKWDLVGAQARALDAEIERRLRGVADVPVLHVSARTGKGVSRVLGLARRLAAAAGREIPTAELNRWLQDSVRKHEPAMAQRGPRKRPVKFFYATQTATRPPTFLLFCTEPASVQPAYRRFLENRLRERFDLAGVPVRLRLRKRSAQASSRAR